MPGEWLESLITVALATHPDVALYVGCVDGRAVVSGSGRAVGADDRRVLHRDGSRMRAVAATARR